jgi:hypothetical protein
MRLGGFPSHKPLVTESGGRSRDSPPVPASKRWRSGSSRADVQRGVSTRRAASFVAHVTSFSGSEVAGHQRDRPERDRHSHVGQRVGRCHAIEEARQQPAEGVRRGETDGDAESRQRATSNAERDYLIRRAPVISNASGPTRMTFLPRVRPFSR